MSRRTEGGELDTRLPAAELKIPPAGRVFCNRKLKMSRIKALGFDQDHTLALYQSVAIEELAFRCTIDKMLTKGYPEEILHFEYDRSIAIRGLVVDKPLGNLIKLDRYKYVVDGCHGSRRLSEEERRAAYATRRMDLADPAFHNLDTLFTLPEAVLFIRMVDMADRLGKSGKPAWDYREIFDHIRVSIDSAHRDGTLKSVVLADLARFFVPDPNLPETLARLRAGGKKLFLLTNSERTYCEAVMGHILPPPVGKKTWKHYFDLIAVSSKKPDFFAAGHPLEVLEQGEGYVMIAGGNVGKLEALLGASGDDILYFGDHTYGDIMKSKKMCMWRTAMVVEELPDELDAARKTKRQHAELLRFYNMKSELQDRLALELDALDGLRRRKVPISGQGPRGKALEALDHEIQDSERRLRKIDARLTRILVRIEHLEDEIDAAFNPSWGPLFRAHTEKSRIGDQIEDFACLYTARVSNFLHYPVNKYFVSSRERMVHEL